ncbi:elongation of very long chain fatty acids protein AAEL008004-like [Schistocerca nitens]|uniref:elongation of very long chain fatty acids protein AAEL008004-like n=1 Tax=Schistocerca nitens TaxID=7011 RepID=UPI0021193DFE|nr:elongation of very long chain fatty acids protein AAEL008004-like [Schistocerca nitens]
MSTGLVQNMTDTYQYFFDEMADPRVSDWWMMDRPWPLLALLSCYLYFSVVWGPRYMSSRKPFDLKPVIVAYNCFQIVASFLIFISLVLLSWRRKITLGCEVTDYSNHPDSVKLVSVFWYGMIVRMADLTETAIFVLRKKFLQASFLHLYHHTTSLLLSWSVAKYTAGGVCVFPLMVNSLVHTVMYTYYLLSAIGALTATETVLHWKRRLTTFQMVQFVILIIHSMNMIHPDCPVPRVLFYLHFPNLVMNFYLFYGFYQRAYNHATKCAKD